MEGTRDEEMAVERQQTHGNDFSHVFTAMTRSDYALRPTAVTLYALAQPSVRPSLLTPYPMSLSALDRGSLPTSLKVVTPQKVGNRNLGMFRINACRN